MDPTKGRKPVLGSSKQLGGNFTRVFELMDGDHAPFHVTFAMLTFASGTMGDPFIIHSRPGVEKPALNDKDVINIRLNGKLELIENTTKTEVSVSQNGSMTRDLFFEWCMFFIANCLPSRCGKGKLPFFLTIDGHTSRWSYEGMRLLKENNVYVVCLPSHTSIFSQPNDAGSNSAVKWIFGDHARDWRSTHRADAWGKMDRSDFNGIFVSTIHDFNKRAAEELESTGSNVITRSWHNVGLDTGNRENEFWTKSIAQGSCSISEGFVSRPLWGI